MHARTHTDARTHATCLLACRKARPSEENEATSALTDEWPASKRARRSRPVNQALLPGELWEHVLGFLTELSPLWGVTGTLLGAPACAVLVTGADRAGCAETARDLCNASASCRALYAATQSVSPALALLQLSPVARVQLAVCFVSTASPAAVAELLTACTPEHSPLAPMAAQS